MSFKADQSQGEVKLIAFDHDQYLILIQNLSSYLDGYVLQARKVNQGRYIQYVYSFQGNEHNLLRERNQGYSQYELYLPYSNQIVKLRQQDQNLTKNDVKKILQLHHKQLNQGKLKLVTKFNRAHKLKQTQGFRLKKNPRSKSKLWYTI